MFTHADFNRDGRQIGRGFICRPGYFPTIATLWRFECGDCAWWVRGQFIVWPHTVRLQQMQLRAAFQLFDAAQLGTLGTRIDGR